jgi:uncharacterized protein (TIGR03435 family)
MHIAVALVGLVLLADQRQFEVASIKLSERTAGPDFGNRIARSPTGFTATNTTLKRLIGEAYFLQPFQILGGPKWMSTTELDVAARSASPAAEEERRLMLQALLAERFHLKVHRENRETKVYALTVEKNGPKLKPESKPAQGGSGAAFHGNLQQFASFLAVQLTIPVLDDPTKPGIASGPPIPVLDRTALSGEYDIDVQIRLEPGADMFTLWQRVLREELGLRLESTKARVEFLVVDSADRTPAAN